MHPAPMSRSAPLVETATPPRPLRFGEALRQVHAISNRNPRFALGSLGGRYVLLCVVADLMHPDATAALELFAREKLPEAERVTAVFCADSDTADEPHLEQIAATSLVFHDPEAAHACGLIDPSRPAGQWILIDPSLRGLGFWPLAQGAAAFAALASTPAPADHAGTLLNAPILIAPRVFEPEFCATLINYYRERGGRESGITQQHQDGTTFVKLDDTFKRRQDCLLEDANLRDAAMQRIYWRLGPEIEKAFAWKPTRMERYLVARYDSESGGFFKPHRDNTTMGTAHRRFAVTINLNAGEYQGGDLRFPEFGSRTYRAPTGGAVVFSCSLLHEATPVTKGVRYAFLPFLYDDAAARLRAQNSKYLDESITGYLSDS